MNAPVTDGHKERGSTGPGRGKVDNNAAAAMYEAGRTLQEIADVFGVSRQRIHQVLKDKVNMRPRRRPMSSGEAESKLPSGGTPLRRLTTAGITEAQVFLQYLRDNPDADRTPPHELLHGEYSRRLEGPNPVVEPRTFSTRREAGEYLSSVLAPVRNQIMNHAGVWSWLGMYFLTGTAPTPLSPNNMTLIFESGENTSNAGRSEQQTYRHYLWNSWRLYEQHGEKAAFLLDQPISSLDDLSQRTFGSRRVFTSVGVVEVILRLYTDGKGKKRGHVHSPGGLRHLFRVLPQLELTYDVYGMEADAVLRILPAPFRRWDAGTG